MLLAGFQRREKKFASFPELVATINKVRETRSRSPPPGLAHRVNTDIRLLECCCGTCGDRRWRNGSAPFGDI